MSDLVNTLGALAGTVWIASALYFQMVRSRTIHPAYTAALFLIGVALMLGSASLAIRETEAVMLAATVANALFLGLGFGVWYVLERAADIKVRKHPDPDGSESNL